MVPGTRREQQKAETQALILGAARDLFQEKGFEETTMRAVADRAGVALGTIFNYVPDKGSLLIASMIRDLDELEEEITDTTPWDEPFVEQVAFVFGAIYRFWERRPKLARYLMREAWFVSGPWGDEYKAQTEALVERGAAMLQLAKQRGELRQDADSVVLFRAIYAHYLYGVMRDLDTPAWDVDRLLAETRLFVAEMMHGIGPGHGPREEANHD